jgi:hypothetical protein
MKKFFLIASIILLSAFLTTSVLSFGLNTNLKDAHAVENIFNSFSVTILYEKYLPLETYYDGPQNNLSPLIEPLKLLLLGVGLIFLSLMGRKTFNS